MQSSRPFSTVSDSGDETHTAAVAVPAHHCIAIDYERQHRLLYETSASQ
jgi:hypothetical protein